MTSSLGGELGRIQYAPYMRKESTFHKGKGGGTQREGHNWKMVIEIELIQMNLVQVVSLWMSFLEKNSWGYIYNIRNTYVNTQEKEQRIV